jgi:hypothetical protein
VALEAVRKVGSFDEQTSARGARLQTIHGFVIGIEIQTSKLMMRIDLCEKVQQRRLLDVVLKVTCLFEGFAASAN